MQEGHGQRLLISPPGKRTCPPLRRRSATAPTTSTRNALQDLASLDGMERTATEAWKACWRDSVWEREGEGCTKVRAHTPPSS